MKDICAICGKDYEKENNKKTCSPECGKKLREKYLKEKFNQKKYLSTYYLDNVKGKREFTPEQIEANRKRNRNNYRRKKGLPIVE